MPSISYSASLHNELAKQGSLLKWKEYQSGPRHKPMWCAVAIVNDTEQCMGHGATKTLAKEAAALMTLSRLGLPVPQYT